MEHQKGPNFSLFVITISVPAYHMYKEDFARRYVVLDSVHPGWQKMYPEYRFACQIRLSDVLKRYLYD